MEILKKNKDSILNYLTIFSKDPLSEWLFTSDTFTWSRFNMISILIIYGEDKRISLAKTLAMQVFNSFLEQIKPTVEQLR